MAGLPLEQSEDRVDISLRASFQIASLFDEFIRLVRGSGLAGNIDEVSVIRALALQGVRLARTQMFMLSDQNADMDRAEKVVSGEDVDA